MAKSETYNKLIHTRRWLMLRRRKLTENPLCERCLEEGRYVQATEVHHVMPVEDALSPWGQKLLMYDFHNLQSLCHHCHVAVHTEMGRSGKQQNRRKTERQKQDFRKRFMQGEVSSSLTEPTEPTEPTTPTTPTKPPNPPPLFFLTGPTRR